MSDIAAENICFSNGRDGYISRFTVGQGSLTFAAKDTIDIKGHPTKSGCKAFANQPLADSNAWIISRFLDAGYVLKGKTALHELAFGVTGVNYWSGTPINPQYPELIPGGSSSGSAAVVAGGLVDFAIGTDTGGSVRMPAACCGVIGFKPGFSAISRQGVSPAISSLDCVGFFAREMGVLKQVLGTLSFPGSEQKGIFNPAVVSGKATAAIDQRIADVLKAGRFNTTHCALRHFDAAHQAGIKIISYENWQAFGHIAEHPDVSPDVKTRIKQGGTITHAELIDAETVRKAFTEELDTILAKHRFLILPTLPELPPTLTEATDPLSVINLTRLLRPFNLSGHPAITLPVGKLSNRPVNMQIVAEKGNELGLLEFSELVSSSIQPI
jgi:amidase